MLGYKSHGCCFGKIPKRPELDAELVGDKYDGSMTRDDAFEKLHSCENEETAQTGVVNRLRLSG